MPDCCVDFTLPEKLKEYTIEEFLGHGKYGYIYRGRHKSEGYSVVVKFGSELDKRKNYATLKREIEILSLLNHENIVQLVDFWIHQEDANCQIHHPSILITECCISDLEKIIGIVNFSLAEIKGIGKHIFQGLDYLQSRQFIHGDIKPANIQLSSTGVLKICGFACARPYGFYAATPALNLTYSAPEILLGVRHLGYAVDSWSVGCIIGQLYSGAPIFQNTSKNYQLQTIFTFCGTFGNETMSILRPYLPENCKRMRVSSDPHILESSLMDMFNDSSICDLLSWLLKTDPGSRWTSKQALESHFYQDSRNVRSDLLTLVEKLENGSLIFVENPRQLATQFQ